MTAGAPETAEARLPHRPGKRRINDALPTLWPRRIRQKRSTSMVMAQPRARILPINQERRRHQRVRVDVLGRLMLENRQEYPCRIINMSPGGAAVMAEAPGK